MPDVQRAARRSAAGCRSSRPRRASGVRSNAYVPLLLPLLAPSAPRARRGSACLDTRVAASGGRAHQSSWLSSRRLDRSARTAAFTRLVSMMSLTSPTPTSRQRLPSRAIGREHKTRAHAGPGPAALDLLGDPQKAYPVVHVTGTNGKTSTARMIDALLREFGLRTGRFTSPHLQSVRERITIDGEPIDERALRRGVRRDRAVRRRGRLPSSEHPLSFFEVLTGDGLRRFRRRAGRRRRRSRSAWAARGTPPTSPTARSRWSPRSRSTTCTSSATTVADDRAARRPGSSSRARTAVIAQQSLEVAEVLLRRAAEVGATVAREGLEFGVLARSVAVGGQLIVAPGPGRRVRRGVPAAARRAPGPQRGAAPSRRSRRSSAAAQRGARPRPGPRPGSPR